MPKRSQKPKTLTYERAREVFNYDPNTGKLSWKVATSFRVRVGDVIDSQWKPILYYVVMIDGAQYLVHRVIRLWMTGKWPVRFLDHANGVKTDNRWCNLREASTVENQHNKPVSKRNKCGYKGVYFSKDMKKWTAEIMSHRVHMHLGFFDTAKEAAHAYNEAALKHHKKFANLNVIN